MSNHATVPVRFVRRVAVDNPRPLSARKLDAPGGDFIRQHFEVIGDRDEHRLPQEQAVRRTIVIGQGNDDHIIAVRMAHAKLDPAVRPNVRRVVHVTLLFAGIVAMLATVRKAMA